jgi:hypothetical protein
MVENEALLEADPMQVRPMGIEAEEAEEEVENDALEAENDAVAAKKKKNKKKKKKAGNKAAQAAGELLVRIAAWLLMRALSGCRCDAACVDDAKQSRGKVRQAIGKMTRNESCSDEKRTVWNMCVCACVLWLACRHEATAQPTDRRLHGQLLRSRADRSAVHPGNHLRCSDGAWRLPR